MTLLLDLFFMVAMVMVALMLIPSVPKVANKTVQKAKDVGSKVQNLRSSLSRK